MVVSAYQVCENSLVTAGPSTCWKQQWRQHRKWGYKEPDPQILFLKDFKKIIDQQIGSNEELIIGIDTNETDSNGTGLQTFFIENDLVDAFSHLHPNTAPPNTYQHSNNRLDYIFISPALILTLKAVGFLLFNVPFLTDYGVIFADFDKEVLFLGDTDNPLDTAQRNLVANNPACHDKYVKLLSKHFKEHNMCGKVADLNNKVQTGAISAKEATGIYE
eukprot:10894954-Ditylum_brightwellii.AAC.1